MQNSQPWYKNAVFYELYVRAFCDSDGDGHGDLRGVLQKLDYLQDLGVDCLWLLPLYPSPLRDDGYDIADYYGILTEYGDLEDFKALIDAVHARGMRIITDLVLNHTSDQHPWFQAARADRNSPYREYYVWSDTDQKYENARIIFLDSEASNWTWDATAGQYYWHRFYASQPDLNYDNPAVREEMWQIMRYWLDYGVDGFRADAVPYLFERDGTNCENLPETHAYLKEIRARIDRHCPGRILLAEANQWPQDACAYFGEGDEFHMGFHFPLMPRIYLSLKQEDKTPIRWILERTPEIPAGSQWCTFLRNHDELTLEMVTEEERQWMWEQYAPESRMRLNLGIRRRLAPLLDNDRRKIELANSLLFTLPGSPIVYYGDEIGMGDDIWLADRNGVRTPMQWDQTQNGGFSSAKAAQLYTPVISQAPYSPGEVNVTDQQRSPDSLFNAIRRMIALHKQHPAFSSGSLDWVNCEMPAIAAYYRTYQQERILVVQNLSSVGRRIQIQIEMGHSSEGRDLIGGGLYALSPQGELAIELKPYQYLWIQI